jgi:hypothetical protein
VDRVTACLDASTFERDFDPTSFADTAALLRRGAAYRRHAGPSMTRTAGVG